VRAAGPALAGGVAGHVRFRGELPPPVRVPVVKDRHAGGHVVCSEALLVAPDTGGVQDAVVWLAGVPVARAPPWAGRGRAGEPGVPLRAPGPDRPRGDTLVVTNHDAAS
jgi:hypothetical protein